MADTNYMFLSSLEKVVYGWLTKNNIRFTMQNRFGGFMEAGSIVVDFILIEFNIVLRIMGSYWHTGLEAEGRDIMGKELLIGQGYQVVDLWEENLAPDKLEGTMQLALQGQEAPR